MYWTNQATEWARAGGDYQLVSFIQGRNINIAYWAGQYQHAAELAEASRRVPWHVPPGLASLIARDGAATSAMLGDKAAAHAQLDEAADLLARRDSSGRTPSTGLDTTGPTTCADMSHTVRSVSAALMKRSRSCYR